MTSPITRRRFLTGAALIVLFAFGLRIARLMTWPLWLDEAWHITWTHDIMAGRIFTGLQSNQWLYPALLTGFWPQGPEGPFLGRYLGVLAGTLAAAGSIHLGRLLHDRATGLAAGLLTALLPLTLFYDRQAMVEPVLALFVVLSLIAMIRLARRPGLRPTVLLALSLAAAYLTKTSAVPYLALPPLAALMFAPRGRRRSALLGSLIGAALGWGIVRLVHAVAAQTGMAVDPSWVTSLDNTIFFRNDRIEPVEDDLLAIGDALIHYLGLPVLALIGAAFGWAAANVRRREVVFLSIPAFAFMAAPVIAVLPGGALYSRFLTPNAPPLIALAALSLSLLAARLVQWPPAGRRMARAGLLLAITLPALRFAWLYLTSPTATPLSRVDSGMYQVSGLDYDGNWRIIADALLAERRAQPDRRIGVFTEGRDEYLAAYLGPANISTASLYWDIPFDENQLGDWLARGDQVFLVDDVEVEAMIPTRPTGVRAELVDTFELGLRRSNLYRLVGVRGQQARRVYALRTPDPARMTGDFAALGAWLDARRQAGTALVVPENHAEALAAHTRQPVEGLRLAHWPPDPGQLARVLDRQGARFQAEADIVPVILVDEAHLDPQRALLTALQQRLYRLDGAWFGLLHAQVYTTGPQSPSTASHTVFQGGITLDAAVIDAAPAPGSTLRLYLRWQTPVPVMDRYGVFVHVVDSAGAIAAQSDSEPGGGLLPMTIWQPGEPVIDRLAVALPPDLPPGVYEVRIGIYHPASLLRLPVLEGVGGGDYARVGAIPVTAGE